MRRRDATAATAPAEPSRASHPGGISDGISNPPFHSSLPGSLRRNGLSVQRDSAGLLWGWLAIPRAPVPGAAHMFCSMRAIERSLFFSARRIRTPISSELPIWGSWSASWPVTSPSKSPDPPICLHALPSRPTSHSRPGSPTRPPIAQGPEGPRDCALASRAARRQRGLAGAPRGVPGW